MCVSSLQRHEESAKIITWDLYCAKWRVHDYANTLRKLVSLPCAHSKSTSTNVQRRSGMSINPSAQGTNIIVFSIIHEASFVHFRFLLPREYRICL